MYLDWSDEENLCWFISIFGPISAIVTPNGQGGLNAGPILGLDKKHCSVGSDNMLAFYLLVLVMLVGHIITQDVIFHAQLLCTKRVSYRYISLLGHTLLGLGLVGQINLTLWSYSIRLWAYSNSRLLLAIGHIGRSN